MAEPKAEKKPSGTAERPPETSGAEENPRTFDGKKLRFGPSWLPWVFLAAWALFMAYLVFLAAAKTERGIKARQPFEDNSMKLKF